MPILQKSFSALFITSLLFTGSVASLKEVHAQTSIAPPASLSITNILIQDELYFGRNRPVGEVSEEQFQKFLQTVVTPRFPDGLTVVNANGQFRGSSGQIIREKTKLVILIHPNSKQKNRAVQEIIDKYKAQFQQESVLRVQVYLHKSAFKNWCCHHHYSITNYQKSRRYWNNMQKLFLTTTLSVALVPFMCDFSFASPLSVGSQYPEVLSNADSSVCYIQLADGKTLDLGILCQPKNASNNYQASYYLLEQCKARSQRKRWASLNATQPSNLVVPTTSITSLTRC